MITRKNLKKGAYEQIFMKRILLLTISIITLTLFGCASVPDEVKNDMTKYNNKEENKSDFDFSYINVSDLQNDTETALTKDYGQFKISDKIKFIAPDEINIMSFKPVSDFLSKADKAIGMFYTKEQLSAQEISNDDHYYEFWNEKDKLYGSVCDDGFIAVLKPDAFDISFNYSEPNVKIYHVDRKDNLNDEYRLKDQKCSVKEAVEYVDNWLDKEYGVFFPDLDYNVKTVIVRKHEGNYLYEISAEASYKGVPIDSYTTEMEEDKETHKPTGKMLFYHFKIEIQMINKNMIDSFTSGSESITEPKVEESVNKCISLESALNYCRNTFTDFKNTSISNIDVMYTLNPVYEYDKDEKPYIVGYNLRPVWEIIIDVPPEEFIPKGEENTYGDMRKYIYIDMITGECKYDFDVVMQGLGG